MCILRILTDLCSLIGHKKTCLEINWKQNLNSNSGSIGFKNHFKQLAVSFKIYADFECNVKGVKSNDKNNASYTKKYQDHISCSFAYKVVCIDDKFSCFLQKKNCSQYIY